MPIIRIVECSLAVFVYRLMERIDGEGGVRIVSYRLATVVKEFCKQFIA
jgi:acetylornithine/succinyldiaminopimelate/putrescine aminotransferase